MSDHTELVKNIRFKTIPLPIYYIVGFMSVLRLIIHTNIISLSITIVEIALSIPIICLTSYHLNESKYEMLNHSLAMFILSSELLAIGLFFSNISDFLLLWILFSIVAILSGIIYENINWKTKLDKWSFCGKIDLNNSRIYIMPNWHIKENNSLISQYIIVSTLMLLCIITSIIISIIMKSVNEVFIIFPLSLIGFGISGIYFRRYIWIVMYQLKYKTIFLNELGPL